MNSPSLFAGLLLPWLAGALSLIAIEARCSCNVQPNRLRQAGYGFFLGYAVMSLAVLASDRALGQVSWPWIMALLMVLAICGAAALWFGPRPAGAEPAARAPLGKAGRILLLILIAWTGLHLFFAAAEVLNQPLYPWDAWLAWVYRAKAWFLAGGMVDIISPAQWAQSAAGDVYTIDAWTYPPVPSAVPYWAALGLGHWSETLINLPVLLAGIAIGMALYGQCRESGLGPLLSVMACYLLISTPLFATHIALAGYADIWMAGFAGLAFVALMRGAVAGQRFQSVLGLLLLAFAMLVKNEGAVWFLAALLMLALLNFRWRTNLIAGATIIALVWAANLVGVTHVDIPIIGALGVVDGQLHVPFIGHFALEIHDVWRPYRDNFFLMGSWNLLWVLVATALLLGLIGRSAPANPARRAGVVFIAIFLTTQLFIFGFTDQGTWADTYTAINRLPLHFVPALIFAAFIMIHSRALQLEGDQIVAAAGLGPPKGVLRLWSAALLAAALVITGSLMFLARELPQNPAKTLQFGASDMNFVMGSGSADGDRLVIDGFTDGYALLSSGPDLIPSGDYRFLRLSLSSRGSGGIPILFWRRSDTPGELVRLPVRESGSVMIDLSAEDDWRGEVIELGLLFEESGEAFELGPISLETDTLASRVQLTWRSWTKFEAWTQKSVNFLQGGAAKQLVRLPVVVIAWLALSLILGWLLTRLTNRPESQVLMVGGALSFLVAWMVLDLRWTGNSAQQFTQTVADYRGIDEVEKLRRGLDGDIYGYIERLKDEVLPEQPARILIVSDGSVPDYLLQRAKYHLLPHSAYVGRELADHVSTQALDFVVYFGGSDGLTRAPDWGRHWQEVLNRIDSSDYGAVFETVEHPISNP